MKIKIFADGAAIDTMLELASDPLIQGFTTNPSLMRKAGVKHYRMFAQSLIKKIPNKPISFEIFADDLDEMEAQAREIATWGKNVYVKIPVTNSKGASTQQIISKLSGDGIKLNVTAIFTVEQFAEVVGALSVNTPAVLSVFAGRVADTGIDPEPLLQQCVEQMKLKPKAELLWASVREPFNIIQAERVGCDIITVPYDMLKKIAMFGKSLVEFSLETVENFYQDAIAAGYEIQTESVEYD